MLEASIILLELLRPYGVGSGPDVNQLIARWGENEPSALGLAVEELERQGVIGVDRAIAVGTDAQRARYGLRGIVGVRLTGGDAGA